MKKYLTMNYLLRVLMLVAGAIVAGFGIGIWNVTNLGYDPLNIFYHALSNISGIRFSTVTLYGGAALTIATLLVDYKELGIGTLLALYFMSFGIQLGVDVFSILAIQGYWSNVVLHVVGLIILCFGVAVVIKANLGKTIYEALVFGVAKKIGKSFELTRYVFDACFFLAGFFLKGSFGIGTFIAWFGIPITLIFFMKVLKCAE